MNNETKPEPASPEQEIFLKALEKPTLPERAAYLVSAKKRILLNSDRRLVRIGGFECCQRNA
jgi:hypothetical protein